MGPAVGVARDVRMSLARMALDSAQHGETDFARRGGGDGGEDGDVARGARARRVPRDRGDAKPTLGDALLVLGGQTPPGARGEGPSKMRFFDGARDTGLAARARDRPREVAPRQQRSRCGAPCSRTPAGRARTSRHERRPPQ